MFAICIVILVCLVLLFVVRGIQTWLEYTQRDKILEELGSLSRSLDEERLYSVVVKALADFIVAENVAAEEAKLINVPDKPASAKRRSRSRRKKSDANKQL